MHASDTVNVDGSELRAGALTGLFVMAKVPEVTGTDEHWIYGTATTDGVVKSVGRIPSCMACHENAAHERLFGVN